MSLRSRKRWGMPRVVLVIQCFWQVIERSGERRRQIMLDNTGARPYGPGAEVMPVSTQSRGQALEALGLLHPHPEAVTASLFQTQGPFFFAPDKVQVKYE